MTNLLVLVIAFIGLILFGLVGAVAPGAIHDMLIDVGMAVPAAREAFLVVTPWVAVLASILSGVGLIAKECRIADKRIALRINLLAIGGILVAAVIGLMLLRWSCGFFHAHEIV